MQVLEGVDEIAAHGAAQTAAVELDHGLVADLEEVVVEADLTELVDDDGGAGELRAPHQPLQEGRLAGAEKAGEHDDRDARGEAG